jgi:hypothetical protein
VTYELRVKGDGYTLLAGDETILSGPLRNYSAFSGPIDPYETPNFIFLGDNSSNGSARVRITGLSVDVGAWEIALPLVAV